MEPWRYEAIRMQIRSISLLVATTPQRFGMRFAGHNEFTPADPPAGSRILVALCVEETCRTS